MFERKFLIDRYDFATKYALRFIEKREGIVFIPKPVEFIKSNNTFCEPFLEFEESDMSLLMDQLWIAGIRPSKRIIEPQNIDHMNGEIKWLRETADHLMKKP